MDYEIGSRAGDYEILAVLGAGGMGKVYKVRNVISDRVEAMKVLLPNLEGDPDLANRFMREIKVQASLDHTNIAALHTAQRLDNQLMMLMEFVEGVTLEHMLKSGPIPIDKAVDYVGQVLSALSYAHAHGVVHRDIKPANMILTPKGVIKLMDFGIAKLTADRKLTQTGATVGSLFYMSPEQIKGSTDLDARSDLYSLGVALYEMVSGARPFQGDSEYSIMSAHLEKTPVPLLQLDPSLPEALNAVVLMSIEKDPAKRFQTADAFRTALMSVRPQAAAPAPQSAPRPAPVPFSAPMTPAPPNAPSAQAAPGQPAAAQPGGHRGRYLILGSVVTLAVLVVAGTQAPKFLHKSSQTETASAPASVPASAVAPAVQSTLPATTPVSETTSPAPGQAVQNPAQPVLQTRPEQRAASSLKPSMGQQSSRPAVTPSNSQSQAQSSAPAMQQSAPPPAAPAAAQQAAPAPSPAEAAALNEAREQLPQLGIRASAVRASLENLQRSQAKQGLGLRSDIVATAQRMDYQLNAADDALKRGDGAGAKKALDAAEKAVSKIESFLGH